MFFPVAGDRLQRTTCPDGERQDKWEGKGSTALLLPQVLSFAALGCREDASPPAANGTAQQTGELLRCLLQGPFARIGLSVSRLDTNKVIMTTLAGHKGWSRAWLDGAVPHLPQCHQKR